MTEYQKIFCMLENFTHHELDLEESDRFCNEYMDCFYKLSDDLEQQLPQKTFETLDRINLVCDSFEMSPEIRKNDLYCVNEKQLRDKIKKYFLTLDMPDQMM